MSRHLLERKGSSSHQRISGRHRNTDRIGQDLYPPTERPRGGSRFVAMVITACALSSGLSIMGEMPRPRWLSRFSRKLAESARNLEAVVKGAALILKRRCPHRRKGPRPWRHGRYKFRAAFLPGLQDAKLVPCLAKFSLPAFNGLTAARVSENVLRK
jgi:hypothetical protein